MRFIAAAPPKEAEPPRRLKATHHITVLLEIPPVIRFAQVKTATNMPTMSMKADLVPKDNGDTKSSSAITADDNGQHATTSVERDAHERLSDAGHSVISGTR